MKHSTDLGNLSKDGNLWFLLASSCFMIGRLLELELAGHKITLEQAMILKVLNDFGGHATARDIEQTTLRRQHSISIIINRMIRMGLITRTKKINDKRSTISITEKGQNILSAITYKAVDTTFSYLSDKEKRLLSDCLQEIDVKARNLLVANDQPIFLQILAAKKNSGGQVRGRSKIKVTSNQQLWSLLNSVTFTITRLREIELEPLGLSMMQSLVLKILNDNKGTMTPVFLQEITMRQHHSISTLFTRMVKLGLIKRIKGTRGRKGLISVTEKGKKLHDQMTVYGMEMTILTLGTEQKKHLAHCLAVLRNRAKELLVAAR